MPCPTAEQGPGARDVQGREKDTSRRERGLVRTTVGVTRAPGTHEQNEPHGDSNPRPAGLATTVRNVRRASLRQGLAARGGAWPGSRSSCQLRLGRSQPAKEEGRDWQCGNGPPKVPFQLPCSHRVTPPPSPSWPRGVGQRPSAWVGLAGQLAGHSGSRLSSSPDVKAFLCSAPRSVRVQGVAPLKVARKRRQKVTLLAAHGWQSEIRFRRALPLSRRTGGFVKKSHPRTV